MMLDDICADYIEMRIVKNGPTKQAHQDAILGQFKYWLETITQLYSEFTSLKC